MNSKTLKLCVLGAFTFFGFATQGQTTHTVINTSDDATTPPSGSLREAAINATAGDIIRFDPVLLNSGSVTITLADEIDFSNKGVTIKGLYNATDTLYISGDNNSRIFSFSTAQPKVVLDSLVLIKGNGVGDAHSGKGGAVMFYQGYDTLYVTNSTIEGNTASGNGGGIYYHSTFELAPSSIVVTNSTINGNTANNGGGIYMDSYEEHTLDVINSTMSGNSASNGGALCTNFAPISIVNSTIYGNTPSTSGGGISITGIADVDVTSSIIAFNGSSNITDGIISHGYNIFDDAPTGTISTDQLNVLETALNLQPLASNGGATKTLLPGCGSIAINAGNPADNSDAQNGAITGSSRDVGAAERLSLTTHIVMNNNDIGLGSLRKIVADACPTDTIRFDPTLISAGSATITLMGEIAFSKSLVFKGLYNSADTLYISGGNANRHFNITNAGNVTMDSMVLVNGNAGSGNGGSIYSLNSGTLSVTNSTISGNTTNTTRSGGGIFSSTSTPPSSSVSVTNSTISGNTTGYGGGISSTSISVTNSTISGNTSSYYGGGIYSYSSSSSSTSVSVTNSTISGNTTGSGGGIYSSSSSSSSVSVTNSTISGNTASSDGGGIFSSSYISSPSSVSVTNSTISGNTASSNGGGIYSSSSSGSSSINVTGSIIWTSANNNTYNSPGNITSSGYNIFSDAPTGYDATDDYIDVDAADLNLQPLAFNGGTTKTMLPGAGSVAINTGDPADITDAQNRIIVGIRDRGAAESFCSIDSTETKVACESYTWRNGETYTATTSGVEFIKRSSVSGVCDTVFILELTINQPNTGDTTATACESFTWYGTNYTSSATPTHTLTNVAGCDSVVTLNLTINELPDVTTTTTTGTTINANLTNANYQWIDCDNNNAPISGETNQAFTATINGSYAVIVDNGDCSDTSDCVAVTTVGLNENAILTGVSIFPNPTSDQVTVALKNAQENEYTLKVTDAAGRELSTQEMTSNTTQVNLSNHDSGVYFIQVLSKKGQSIHRVIKE